MGAETGLCRPPCLGLWGESSMFRPPLVLVFASVAGCAYITDKDEARRLDPDGDGVGLGEDCDDRDPSVGLAQAWFGDSDGDGFGSPDTETVACAQPSGTVDQGGDCDDSNPSVYPGADDPWYDGVDADCAGNDDFDQDGDGYASADHGGRDCNDTDATVFPGAPEVWYDGVDADCAGDDDFDQDGDGHTSADHGGDDCNDTDPGVRPGAEEVEGNGLDDDCSGDANGNRWEGEIPWGEADATWIGRGDFDGSDLAGLRVAGAGDLDGDGADDLMVAAPNGENTATWLIRGGASGGGLLAREAWELEHVEDDETGALGLTTLGDVNGDGYDDVAIGEYRASWSAGGEGVVWIVYGPGGIRDTGSDKIWEVAEAGWLGPARSAQIGVTLLGAVDVTDDGVSDLLVAAPFSSTSTRPGGQVMVAPPEVDGLGWAVLEDAPVLSADVGLGAWYGWALATGDLQGDGVADVVVGAPYADPTGTRRSGGSVHVYTGPVTEDRSASDPGGLTLAGDNPADRFGMSVATADVDGDGYDDLLAAAVGAEGSAGRVYVVPGPLSGDADVSSEAVLVLHGTDEERFGESIAAGDPDGDGAVDLVVGAPGDELGVDAGAVWVFYGLGRLTGEVSAADVADGTLRGPEARAHAGSSIALLGDSDADGYGDLLVGAPGRATGDAGRAALFLGGAL